MKRRAPLLLFAAVTIAVFWKFLIYGQTMYAMSALETQLGLPPQEPSGWFRSEHRHTRISDNVVVLAGHLRIYNEGLKANELRLWNPYLFCGLPTYADPMIHPFYPPNLLLHRIFAPDTAYELGLMLHLFFSGVALYVLLLHGLGRSIFASTVGALVWMLGGYNAMWFSTGILAGASVFGPLALLAIQRGLATRDRSKAALAGGAMGLAILGSHPQHALLLFAFLLGWIAVAAVASSESRPFALRFGVTFGLLSIGVGLAEILTRLDSIENGYRDPVFDQLSLYAEPGRLASYLVGLIFGKVYFPGPGWESEFPVYLGLAAASLAGLGALRYRHDPPLRYVAIIGALSLSVAFFLPAAWVFTKLPLLNLSPPSRFIYLAGLAASILAAYGVDAFAERPARAPRAVASITVAFLALMTLGFGPARFSNGAAIETLLGFALATGAAFASTWSPRRAAALAIAALLFELLPPFIQFNAHGDSSLLAKVPEPVRRMKEQDGPWRGTGVLGTTARSTKSDQWGNDLVTGNNLLALYGVENVGGFDAIIPRHYVAWASAAGDQLSPAGRTLQFTRFDSPLLDAASLRYVLLPPAMPLPSRYRRIGDYGGVSLAENRAVLPRARFAALVTTVRDEQAAEQGLRDPGFDPRRQTIVESDHPLPASVGEVVWKERTSDHLVLEVTAAHAGTLVIADTDYPGWEARIDRKRVPIYRADIAFRAVEVPAGTHRVELRFRPAPARTGLNASIAFLAAATLLAFYRRAA